MRRVSGWRACSCARESSDRKISPSSSRKNSDRVSGEDRLPPSWGSRLCTIQKKTACHGAACPGRHGRAGPRSCGDCPDGRTRSASERPPCRRRPSRACPMRMERSGGRAHPRWPPPEAPETGSRAHPAASARWVRGCAGPAAGLSGARTVSSVTTPVSDRSRNCNGRPHSPGTPPTATTASPQHFHEGLELPVGAFRSGRIA